VNDSTTTGYVTKDSGERATFSSGMVRDTEAGKTRFDLLVPQGVPFKSTLLNRWAELLTRGAVKYAARNWEKAEGDAERERFRASAFRHFVQWFSGETDEDHAAAVIFNMQGAEYVKERARAARGEEARHLERPKHLMLQSRGYTYTATRPIQTGEVVSTSDVAPKEKAAEGSDVPPKWGGILGDVEPVDTPWGGIIKPVNSHRLVVTAQNHRVKTLAALYDGTDAGEEAAREQLNWQMTAHGLDFVRNRMSVKVEYLGHWPKEPAPKAAEHAGWLTVKDATGRAVKTWEFARAWLMRTTGGLRPRSSSTGAAGRT
jgi:hypothetical protein